jgi:anti-sigma factor RsiW
MKCSEVISRVDQYLDDRLSTTDLTAVRAHLVECSVCREEIEAVSDLRDRTGRLSRSVEPPHDLWPQIAARITREKVVRHRFGRQFLVAAAAVVLLVGSVVTAYLVGRSQAPLVASTASPVAIGPSQILLASFQELGVHDYVATRNELLEALEARRGNLSPETLEMLKTNLEIIDEAMGKIAEALGENPDSEFLMKQLAAAYRRQINLLERAVRLPSEV